MKTDDIETALTAKPARKKPGAWRDGNYEMALLMADFAPEEPACLGIVGERITRRLAGGEECLSCRYTERCDNKIADVLNTVRSAYSSCFGDRTKNRNFSVNTCTSCEMYRDCGDTIHGCMERGISFEKLQRALQPASDSVPESKTATPPPATLSLEAVCSDTSPSSPEADAPAPGYAFPHDDEFERALRDARACADPTLLVERLASIVHSARPYEAIRNEACAVSVALNERCLFPPSLREVRRIAAARPGTKVSPGMSMISNDLQVIDLHWAAGRGFGAGRSLLRDVSFSFELAAQFAAKNWRHSVKAAGLGLSPLEQRELLMLQDRAAKDWVRNVRVGRARVEGAVRDVLRGPRSKLGDERAAIMPHAYVALRFAEGSVGGAIPMFRLVSGAETRRNDLRKCKEWLVKRDLLKDA